MMIRATIAVLVLTVVSVASRDAREALQLGPRVGNSDYELPAHTNSGKNSDSMIRDFPCPVDADIHPCICSVLTDGELHLDCSDVNSDQQLAEIFQQDFPVKTFKDFYLAGNNAIRMLKKIFGDVTFEEVEILNTNIELVSIYALEGSESTLRSLSISSGKLDADTFPLHLLNEFNTLYDVSLRYQMFSWLPPITSSSIQYLTFYGNEIRTIEPGTFRNLPNLRELDVGNNFLTVLLPDSFFLPNDFITIRLASNSIAEVQPGAFVLPVSSGSLYLYLHLDHNQLTIVDEAAFGAIFPRVSYIDLTDNPLDCGCDIAWLVLNTGYMSKIDSSSKCEDGRLLYDLDPQFYMDFC